MPSSEPTSTQLRSLLGAATGGRLTAAQAVERMRLWEAPDGGPRMSDGGPRMSDGGPRMSDGGPRVPDGGPRVPDGGPRVFLNMVSTADGRATLQGRSGPIGNRADRELFHALRTSVDAVLVGAGTARAERYRRLVRDQSHRQLRHRRGLSEEPLACIVSASLALSAEQVPLLADPAARVVVLTSSPGGELPALGGPQATPGIEYVRAARDGALDLPAALGELHARWGVRTVLCEGGPHLNGDLLRAGVVDEVFLSLAPKLGGGGLQERRIVCGAELHPPAQLELLDALESESCLLLRYGVSR